jgi:hypothetical protein
MNHSVFCQVHCPSLLSEKSNKFSATVQKYGSQVTNLGNLVVVARVYFKPRPVIEPHMFHEENKQFRHAYLHSRIPVSIILADQLTNRFKNIDPQSFIYVYIAVILAMLGESRQAAPFWVS